MKKSRLLGAVCACFLLFGYQPTEANSIDSQIHLSLNPTFNPATDTVGTVGIGSFDVYVIADNFTSTNGIQAAEFSIDSLNLGGSSFTALAYTIASPGGIDAAGGITEVAQAWASPKPTTGPVVLGFFTLLATAPLVDELLVLKPLTSPSIPGELAWVDGVDTGTIQTFDFASVLLLNQVSFPTPPGSPIPIPAALWLFGSGLLGLVGVARRKKAA